MVHPKPVFLILFTSLALNFCASSQKKIEKENENSPQYQYEKALLSMRYGLLDASIRYLEKAISLDPAHHDSYSLLGLIQFKNKNYDASIAAYEKCLELRQDVSEVHNNLGFVYQEKGLLEKAEEEYKNAVSLDGNADASYNLAKLYFDQEKFEQALESARASIQKNDQMAPVYNLQGVILNELGRYPEAIASFRGGLSIKSDDPVTRVNLSIAYINNKNFEEARRLLQDTIPLVRDQSLKQKILEYLKMIEDR